jgi:hypothetical protein
MLEQEDILNAPEITKFNFGCDDIIDENIPEPLPKFSWFRMGLIGRSRIICIVEDLVMYII